MRTILCLFLFLCLPATSWAGAQGQVEAASLSELAASFAREAQEAATRQGVALHPRTLSAGDGLQVSAALEILAADVDRRLGSATAKKTRAALPAVLEVRGNRLFISASLLDANGYAIDAAVASIPLSPSVEKLLDYGPLQAAGFTLRRVGTLSEKVLDADAGDLDADGRDEVVVLTDTQLHAIRYAGGRVETLASTALPRAESTQPVRDPRGVVSIAEGARGQSTWVYARLAEREQTHEATWSGERFTFRGQRSDVVFAPRLVGTTNVLSMATFEPGTNWLRADISVGTSRRGRKRSIQPFYTLRAVDGGSQVALLDTTHTLHLYDVELTKRIYSVDGCGAGFAVADFVGDATPEVLCSGTDLPTKPDRVRLIDPQSGEVLWTSPELPGGVGAIVSVGSGKQKAAMLFVDDAAGGTTLWWLRRGY